MRSHEADKLIAVIRELAEPDGHRSLKAGEALPVRTSLDRPHQKMNAEQERESARIGAAGQAGAAPTEAAVDFEVFYQRFKRRLLDELKVDPVFVKLLASQPEIMVEIEPRVIEMDGASLKGRVARLMAGGFFKEARKSGAVRTELARTGTDPGSGGRLSEALAEYVAQGFLTREGEAYALAPGVKVSEKVLTVA